MEPSRLPIDDDQIIDSEFDPREFYPLISKTATAAGWADPLMDVYDH